MGQSSSSSSSPTVVSTESQTKSQRLFASLSKTLPPLSQQDYSSIFNSLAETDDASIVKFWKEDSLARFLKVPPKVGSLLFKSASYLAALPALENVPVPLDYSGLGIAIMVLTQQIPEQVLTKRELTQLVFNSFADVTRTPTKDSSSKEEQNETSEMPNTTTYGPQISVSRMIELILFLLSHTYTPESFSASESHLASATDPDNRHSAAIIAKAILSAIQNYAKSPSDEIHYDAFRAFIERDAPYFFDALVPLFQRFLYDKKKWGEKAVIRADWIGALETEVLTELMNMSTLAQLSMFFPKEKRLGKLVCLYAGSKDGFSMGMFESKVLKYPGTSTSKSYSDGRPFNTPCSRDDRRNITTWFK
jgi:hypothetical protein